MVQTPEKQRQEIQKNSGGASQRQLPAITRGKPRPAYDSKRAATLPRHPDNTMIANVWKIRADV
jgi:hypothetical protein